MTLEILKQQWQEASALLSFHEIFCPYAQRYSFGPVIRCDVCRVLNKSEADTFNAFISVADPI